MLRSNYFCSLVCPLLFSLCLPSFLVPSALAQNSAVAPMIRLVEGGKLPEQRIPTVLGLICKRGDAVDLAFVFDRIVAEDGLSAENRLAGLDLLAQTARDRNLKPAGDLNRLGGLLEQAVKTKDVALQQQVIALVGVWKVQSLAGTLSAALKTDVSEELAGSILKTLAELGGAEAGQQIASLTQADTPRGVRGQAIAALAGIDLPQAATAAALFLEEASDKENFDALLRPFLARPQGPELLGKAIASRKISADIAKLALRSMLTAGRNDEALSDPLSAAAGLDNSMKTLTAAEMQALVQEVLTHGDAARGEQIFRREELNCYKCHAIGQAGGNIGPDLIAVGGSSPIDYLVNSLLLPSESIKEAYKTVLVVDIDGLSHIGIVVDRDDDRMILRDAQGLEKAIAIDDIEFEKEGESLMPAGLTKFLTHQEFVDLIKYMSALGKDQGYIMPADPTVYRWRVYENTPGKVSGELFDDESVRNMLFEFAPENWKPLYSLASGEFPVAEALKLAGHPVIFASAELDVNVPGNVRLQLNSTQGITFWLDNTRIPTEKLHEMEVTTGKHRLLFRIDTQEFKENTLQAVLLKGSAPAAEYSIQTGQ